MEEKIRKFSPYSLLLTDGSEVYKGRHHKLPLRITEVGSDQGMSTSPQYLQVCVISGKNRFQKWVHFFCVESSSMLFFVNFLKFDFEVFYCPKHT